MHLHRLFPRLWLAENGSRNTFLAEHVECRFSSQDSPPFMPRHYLVVSRRNIGELELSVTICHSIVGMRNHVGFGVPPYMPAITLQVDDSRRVHLAGDH